MSTAAKSALNPILGSGPAGELVDRPVIEVVGARVQAIQFVQVFTASVAWASRHGDATTLTDFLETEQVVPAIRRVRIEPAGPHRSPAGRTSPR